MMFRRSGRAAASSRARSSASSTPSSSPERAEAGERQRRRRARTAAQGDRARRGACSRTSASSRTRPPTSSRPSGRSSSATGASSMQSATEWIASLSPWPRTGSGSSGCRRSSTALGNPERALRRRSTSSARTASRPPTRTIAALSRADGLAVGAYTLPARARLARAARHGCRGGSSGRSNACAPRRRGGRGDAVRGADRGRARRLRRSAASTSRSSKRGSAAGSTRRTCSTRAVVLLTNVGLEHTECSATTREQIAREKLAVAQPGPSSCCPTTECAPLVRRRTRSPARRRPRRRRRPSSATRPTPQVEVALAGPPRASRGDREVRDGAHTPEAVDWLLERLPRPHDYVVVASILADKDVDEILGGSLGRGRTLIATTLVERARAARGGGRRPRRAALRARSRLSPTRRAPSPGPGPLGEPSSSPAPFTSLPISRTDEMHTMAHFGDKLIVFPSPSAARRSSSGSRSRRDTSLGRILL